MTIPPETRYAKSGDINIAYQVIGNGPLDLVVVPGWISHLDLWWESSSYAAWVKRLASYSRVILFDKRGTGLSDRDVGDSTLEDRMDDLRAVLDAAGSQRAAVFGYSEGGPLSMLFAATYPERVQALVLCATFARGTGAADYPEGKEQQESFDELLQIIDTAWGKGTSLALFAPSLQYNEAVIPFMQRFERAAASPRAARTHLAWLYDIDVRPVAHSLNVPTLILHRSGDRMVRVAVGRWLAANIPGARYVEQPGDDHAPWLGDAAGLLDEIQHFLTGSRGEVEPDRVLATVLFTDIVGSTGLAARLGDRHWRRLLEAHNRLFRAELARFRGREVHTTGDGFLASFDGPARAIRCAAAIRDAVAAIGLTIRAGLHTGEIEILENDVAGIAVHLGARVSAMAGPGEVLVSSTVKDLVVGSGLSFVERGVHVLKGVPGEWRLFAAEIQSGA
jgi:pimeloyl-ACP methyl ester carboxylesterase